MWFPGGRHFTEALSLEVIHSYKEHKEGVNYSIWYMKAEVQSWCYGHSKEGGGSRETAFLGDQSCGC